MLHFPRCSPTSGAYAANAASARITRNGTGCLRNTRRRKTIGKPRVSSNPPYAVGKEPIPRRSVRDLFQGEMPRPGAEAPDRDNHDEHGGADEQGHSRG